jgi:hypothetical protein
MITGFSMRAKARSPRKSDAAVAIDAQTETTTDSGEGFQRKSIKQQGF